MKPVPFSNAPTSLFAVPDPLTREANLDDVFLALELNGKLLILFIDQAEFCQSYVIENPWINKIASVVEVDRDLAEFFDIKQVPTWAWFYKGSEAFRLIGTVAEYEVCDVFTLLAEGDGSHE